MTPSKTNVALYNPFLLGSGIRVSGSGTCAPLVNNYFTEMCSGSEAGSYLSYESLNSRLESNNEEDSLPGEIAVLISTRLIDFTIRFIGITIRLIDFRITRL